MKKSCLLAVSGGFFITVHCLADSFSFDFSQKGFAYRCQEITTTTDYYGESISVNYSENSIHSVMTLNYDLHLKGISNTKEYFLVEVSAENISAKFAISVANQKLNLWTTESGSLEGTHNGEPIEPNDDRYLNEFKGLYSVGTVKIRKNGNIMALKAIITFVSFGPEAKDSCLLFLRREA